MYNWKNHPKSDNHFKLIERLKKAEEKHRTFLLKQIKDASFKARLAAL